MNYKTNNFPGKLEQTIYGHHDVVTCLTRSETYIAGDCYFVTGSMDTTLMLWYWSGRRSKIIGSDNNYDGGQCGFRKNFNYA